jgi:hypothetical protein
MKKLQIKTKILASITFLSFGLAGFANAGAHSEDVYGPFPVTLKGYSGDCTNTVSYSGQIARHAQHDSLKAASTKGSYDDMNAYYIGADGDQALLAPSSKDGFPIMQTLVNEISSGKNLSGKTYKGTITAWPNNMTAPEVIDFWMMKAADNPKDVSVGLNYQQLLSKFIMGAVFYNQAVDNYLDEKMGADSKPNDKPYKDGACYTGKEHSWDEAFGYWGAAAHSLLLSAEDNYNVAKRKDLVAADYNGDGVVDLKSEYVFAHAYYASSFDKGGKTSYLEDITRAFLDGRKLITSANGEKLSDAQRSELMGHVNVINENWQKVIAESVFKYAGSTYKSLVALESVGNADLAKEFDKYMKYWGELKGFSMALQVGKENIGETATKLNRMVGFGPMLLDETQIVGIKGMMGSDGKYIASEYEMGKIYSMHDAKLHMLKIQKLMIDQFGVEARGNDMLAEMSDLASKIGTSDSAEND